MPKTNKNSKSTGAKNFGVGRPIPEDSTTVFLVHIFVGINFIDTWLNNLTRKLCYVVVPIKRI